MPHPVVPCCGLSLWRLTEFKSGGLHDCLISVAGVGLPRMPHPSWSARSLLLRKMPHMPDSPISGPDLGGGGSRRPGGALEV